MKHTFPLFMCAALLGFSACSIDEVEESHATGTLLFRAENAQTHAAVAGTLEIAGHQPPSFIFADTDSLLTVSGLPLDSALSVTFTPSDSDAWVETGTQQLRLTSAAPVRALTVPLEPRHVDALPVLVTTASGGSERLGLPLWVDGVQWPTATPTTVYLLPGMPHTIEVSNGECVLADSTFSSFGTEMTLLAPFQPIQVQSSAEATVIVDGTVAGSTPLAIAEPSSGDHFISAYRAGHVAAPASHMVDGFCGGSVDFSWTAAEEGYSAGRLFPDFSMPHVVPGQAGSTEDFRLAQVRGRVTLVTFWYATCVNCLEEMPGFQSVLEEYGPRGFQVLALDPYPTDYPENYPAAVAEFDFTFLRDAGSPPVAQLAGVGAFPTNFLILPDGRIHSVRGGMSEDVLRDLLDELLP